MILASRKSLCEFCLLEKQAVGIGILFSYVDDITRVYKHPSTYLHRFNDLRLRTYFDFFIQVYNKDVLLRSVYFRIYREQ